jgi:hypothetical protein
LDILSREVSDGDPLAHASIFCVDEKTAIQALDRKDPVGARSQAQAHAVAYGLSVRNLEEVMAERGIDVDHSTVHRWAIKHRIRPMLGFKTFRCARILLGGIELMHMIKKGQMIARGNGRTPVEQFYSLTK